MARVRWVCERCGSGALGSSRPRKDDVVRFCLKCSAQTGRLVPRSAPSLERKRSAAALRSTEQRATARQRAKAAEAKRFTVSVRNADGTLVDLDLRDTLARCLALPEIRGLLREDRRNRYRLRRGWRPDLVVAHSSTWKCGGHAEPWSDRITLAIGRGLERERVEELVLHELVHIVAGRNEDHGKHWHGPHFTATVLRAARELWPGLPTVNTYRGAYALDDAIWQDARRLALWSPGETEGEVGDDGS